MDFRFEPRPPFSFPSTIALPDVPDQQVTPESPSPGDGPRRLTLTTRTLAELVVIAQAVGSDFTMSVRLGEPGMGSYFDIERCTITLDPLHVVENPDFAKFVAGHEGSHRAITIGPIAAGLPAAEAEMLMRQLGFHAGFNGCEDNAVNTWMVKKFPGLERHKDSAYDKMFSKDNVPVDLPEIAKAAAKLGAYPRFGYVISEILRDWHQGRFSKDLEPEIQKTLLRIIPYVRRFTTLIPPHDADRATKIEFFRERFALYRDFIWPEIRKIVESDLKNESENQLLQEMFETRRSLLQKQKELSNARRNGDESRAEELEDEIEDLKERLRQYKELEDAAQRELLKAFDKALREAAERLKQQIDEARKSLADAKRLEASAQAEVEQLQKAAANTAQDSSERRKLEEAEQRLKEAQDASAEAEDALNTLLAMLKGGGGGGGPRMGELSPETREALRRLMESLPEEVRARCRSRAQSKLEEFDDAVSEELEGKLNRREIKSHAERHAAEEQAQRAKELEKKLEEASREIAHELDQVREALRTPYDRALHEHRDLIHPLYVRLKRFLQPRKDPDWAHGFSSGTQLNLNAAMQAEADPRQRSRLWDRRQVPQTFDYRFSFVVDISSSMEGEKAEETFKALVVLAEVFQPLKIPVEILCFSSSVSVVKSFEEKISSVIQGRIASIPMMVGGGTNDALAIDVAYRRLKKRPGKDNFILVLTDGGSNIPQVLEGVLERIRKERIAKVVAFGLGPGTDDVVRAYPQGYPNLRMRVSHGAKDEGEREFAEVLVRVAEEMVRNPHRF